MTVLSAKITIWIPHALSLKDKRQVRRSVVDRLRATCNASVSEVGTQDVHQTLTLGIAVVSESYAHARKALDGALRFAEDCAEGLSASVLSVEEGT